MTEKLNKPEPKKIKMPSEVDRSSWYDTMSFEADTLYDKAEQINNKIQQAIDWARKTSYEDYRKDDQKSLPELESL